MSYISNENLDFTSTEMKFEFSYWKYLMSPTGNMLMICKNSIYKLLLARICVTHYEGKSNYIALKEITEINEYKIRKARVEHEANEDKAHFLQCRTVPDIVGKGAHAPPPFSKIPPFLEIQDVPTSHRSIRKTKVLNNS